MSHAANKLKNDMAYEIDKAKATDPNLPMSTRAGAAMNAAGDAMGSTYHSAMGGITGESKMSSNPSSAGHAVREAEHNIKGGMNELERKNTAAPTGDRIAAGFNEAGEKIAAAYHGAAKTADKSM